MYMKQNNAGKNMWLWAQTVNQKFQQNAQTQDADGMRTFFCVICDTVRGYIFFKNTIIRGGGSEPSSPTFPLRLRLHSMQQISRCSHFVKFFQQLHTLLVIQVLCVGQCYTPLTCKTNFQVLI